MIGTIVSLPLGCGVKVDLLTSNDAGVLDSSGGATPTGGAAPVGGAVATGGAAPMGGLAATGGQIYSTGGSTVITSVPVDADTLITLERTGCYGECPIYTVSIDGAGNVNYQGERFVQVTGSASSQIPVVDVQQLVNWMMSMNYLNLLIPDSCPYGATDLPSALTSLRITTGYHSVDHYHGDLCAPRELGLIEDLIDQIANTARWVDGTNLLGTGKPCSVDSDCSTGICYDENGSKVCSAPFGDSCWTGVPCYCGNGACSRPCSDDTDCPAYSYICEEAAVRVCIETCSVGVVYDCPTGWSCMPIEHQGSTTGKCSPGIN